jgi:hypothetical protein
MDFGDESDSPRNQITRTFKLIHSARTGAQAKAHCPSGTAVANLQSKIYHFAGSKDYGATERGAICASRMPWRRAFAPRKMKSILEASPLWRRNARPA